MRAAVGWVAAGTVLLTACTRIEAEPTATVAAPATTTTTEAAVSTTTTTTTAAPPPPTTVAPITTTTAPRVRAVTEQPWVPFAVVGDLTLHHTSARVERVGFHQSNHEGALEMAVDPGAVAPVVLESRGRLTGAHTAADIVSDPRVEVRVPVTGTVKRGGTYTLYCKVTDEYAVIEPDGHPGWEVKILHVQGLRIAVGDHVVAGETVLAVRPHQLPFESDVDELRTADPAWPHVHVEVVDSEVKDRPNPGSGGSC